MRQPPAGRLQIPSPVVLARQGLPIRFKPSHDGIRGSNAAAFFECAADPARNGRASPALRQGSSFGTSRSSATSPLRCRRWRRFGARGTSSRPGVKFLPCRDATSASGFGTSSSEDAGLVANRGRFAATRGLGALTESHCNALDRGGRAVPQNTRTTKPAQLRQAA